MAILGRAADTVDNLSLIHICDNTIDVYISDDPEDVLADGIWQQFFTKKPKVLTREEKREWLDTMKGVSLGSDAFFPFGDNIERCLLYTSRCV